MILHKSFTYNDRYEPCIYQIELNQTEKLINSPIFLLTPEQKLRPERI